MKMSACNHFHEEEHLASNASLVSRSDARLLIAESRAAPISLIVLIRRNIKK